MITPQIPGNNSAVTESITTSDTSINCPIDHKSDAIQSVPALVRAGRSSGSFSGTTSMITHSDGQYGYATGTTNLYGILTSELAQILAEPFPPKTIGFWSIVGWAWLFILGMCTFIGEIFVWLGFRNFIAKNPKTQKEIFTLDVTIKCILILTFGVHPITWLFIPGLIKILNNKINYPQRNLIWREAHTKWEKLFYCHRCGIVFSPETKESVPLNQVHDYLRRDEYEL